MKLIPVLYFGHTALDRRFSSPMLPWIVSEIRRTEYFEKVPIVSYVLAYNLQPDMHQQIEKENAFNCGTKKGRIKFNGRIPTSHLIIITLVQALHLRKIKQDKKF